MAGPPKIVLPNNAGPVIKADDGNCYRDPVNTPDNPTGEAAVSSFTNCPDCVDCQVTTNTTIADLLTYMFIHANKESKRVKSPTMRVTVSGAGPGTVKWCGQTWVLPAESGLCYEVKPTNYQLRNHTSIEFFNRRAMNYDYIAGQVQFRAGNAFNNSQINGRGDEFFHLWRRDQGSQDQLIIGRAGYRAAFNHYPNNNDIHANIQHRHQVKVRADVITGGASLGIITNSDQYYKCVKQFGGCTKYEVNGNSIRNPVLNGTDCSVYNNKCADTAYTQWANVLTTPTFSNFKISTTTRATTTAVKALRKGSMVSTGGVTYAWELGSYWGID
jgi:hypothetical protein